MARLTCCEGASWSPERDLGHASGFEYALGKCSACGTHWMNVFCVATSIAGYERVTELDVAASRKIVDAAQLKEFVRRWGDSNL